MWASRHSSCLFPITLIKLFIFALHNPDEMWNEWKCIFLTVADKHAPPITRRVRSEYAPWITKEIKNMIHHRDFLKKRQLKLDHNNSMMPLLK